MKLTERYKQWQQEVAEKLNEAYLSRRGISAIYVEGKKSSSLLIQSINNPDHKLYIADICYSEYYKMITTPKFPWEASVNLAAQNIMINQISKWGF